MKRLLHLLPLLVLSLNLNAQEISSEWPKSTQSISFSGSTLLFATPINASYNYTRHNNAFHYGINAGVTWCFYEIIEYATIGVHTSFDMYFGKKSHHPQLRLGLAYSPIMVYSLTEYTDYDYDFVPVISLGYRYEKPGDDKYWRIFIGTGGIGFGLGANIGK